MKFLEFLEKNIVLLDGGMGTLLQQKGLKVGEKPELWNITHPEIITEIHKSYYEAGSCVVSTNTFGANLLKFSEKELEEIIKKAVENAKKARQQSSCKKEKFIALDVGPCGRLLRADRRAADGRMGAGRALRGRASRFAPENPLLLLGRIFAILGSSKKCP